MPGQAFSFVADLVVIDHKYGTVQLIANVLNDGVDSAEQQWADAQARLDSLQSRLAAPAEAWLAEVDLSTPPDPTYRTGKADFLASVGIAKQHIVDGDIFQVVISQRFDQECTAHPIDVYRVLRSLNPSPYMYLLSLESPANEPYWIVGSSPEALVKVQNDRVFTHPIAGSKPRGATDRKSTRLNSSHWE